MKNKRFYIPGFRDRSVVTLFQKLGFQHSVYDDAELIVLTGGEDINPAIYGESKIEEVNHTNDRRDEEEMECYWQAVAQSKKIVGICRGAQLIHALNGFKLWQDVDNHAIGRSHPVLDLVSGDTFRTTSWHHQMMRVDPKDTKNYFKVVAVSSLSTERKAEGVNKQALNNEPFRDDIEVLWYPEQNSLCYQGHPEGNDKQCTAYFTKLLHRYSYI